MVRIQAPRITFVTGEQPPEPPQVKLPVPLCTWCGQPLQGHAQVEQRGNNTGNSTLLANHIFEGRRKEDHPWYAGLFSLQAHHLICSEAMDDDFWEQVCWVFGYDINHRHNGVMLPFRMTLACQLQAPLHRGNHEAGRAGGASLSYPDGVQRKLLGYRMQIEAGQFCARPEDLRQALDELSAEILEDVASFAWTLTDDGHDYQPGGPGCRGERFLSAKRRAVEQTSDMSCPLGRAHDLRHSVHGSLLLPGSHTLKVSS
jgi:hypothetical protein